MGLRGSAGNVMDSKVTFFFSKALVYYYTRVLYNLCNIYRDFIEQDLVDFAKQHPGVVVYLKPRRHRSPVIVGEYCKL